MWTLAFEEAELILHNIENYLLYREDSILYPCCHGVTAIHCPALNWRLLKLFHTRLQWEDKGEKEDEEEEEDEKKRRRKEKKIRPQVRIKSWMTVSITPTFSTLKWHKRNSLPYPEDYSWCKTGGWCARVGSEHGHLCKKSLSHRCVHAS